MEAKEILKALNKAGMIEKGEICMGKNIRNVLQTIESGHINGQKEYLYIYKDLVYIVPSAVAYTRYGNKVYIYEID